MALLNKGGVNWGKYKIYLISSFKFVFLTFTSSSFYEINTVKHMVSDKIEFKIKLRNSLIKKEAIIAIPTVQRLSWGIKNSEFLILNILQMQFFNILKKFNL